MPRWNEATGSPIPILDWAGLIELDALITLSLGVSFFLLQAAGESKPSTIKKETYCFTGRALTDWVYEAEAIVVNAIKHRIRVAADAKLSVIAIASNCLLHRMPWRFQDESRQNQSKICDPTCP